MKKDITDIRGTIEFLKQEGEIISIKKPVDPIWEKTAILKALDDGPAFLFENSKGYPGRRSVGNIFAKRERLAKIFDVADPKRLKFKCLDAIKHPIPPKVVDNAPCQEVVITQDIDVTATMPILQHTPRDGARVMGSGVVLVPANYARGGHEISFKRMHFRGKDWSSLTASPGSHGETILFVDYRDEDVPVTINIGGPSAVTVVAAGGMIHSIVPLGTDELAIAGALQGSPVEICRAKTVDAYSIAKAEYVIEGFVSTEKVWETDEAEKLGKPDVATFFPEWIGHMGKAWKSRKFQVTAITHRKDPIYYDWCGDNSDSKIAGAPFMEACFYEVAERMIPGLVVDVHKPISLGWNGGVVYQVIKKRPQDEGRQRNILMHALTSQPGIRLIIAVDDDVDIYSTDDVMWAIMSRADPFTDYLTADGSTGSTVAKLLERSQTLNAGARGGLAIDATVPFLSKDHFERPQYIGNQLDLKKWLLESDINAVRSQQSEYARCLSQRGW